MSQRTKPRLIRGVRLEPGGLLPGESRVADWPGGELRVVVRQPKVVEGVPFRDLPIEETTLLRGDYVPFGDGFALPTPLLVEFTQEAPGLEFEIAVREGRPRCVGIRSTEKGPPITTTLLKSGRLPAIGRIVTETVRENAVRLMRTTDGEVVGLHGLSTSDVSTGWDDRVADISAAVDELERAERRWRVTDELLEEVATVYRDAYAHGLSTARAIAQRWGTSEENARRWVVRARRQGFLPPTEPRKARG